MTAAVVAVALAPSGAIGQAWCFEPRPAPKCTSFWITEVNGYRSFVSTHFTEQTASGPFTLRDLPGHANLSIGGMVNHGPTSAFGAALMFGNGSGGGRFGVEARARRWLSPRSAVDVSAGPLQAYLHAHSLSDHTRGYGAGVDVSLMWIDWVGLTARGEVVRAEGRNIGAVYAGVRFGTYPAALVAAGVLALWSLATLGGGPGS